MTDPMHGFYTTHVMETPEALDSKRLTVGLYMRKVISAFDAALAVECTCRDTVVQITGGFLDG